MQQDLTRREALKRGAGLVGALAWAAPVVQVVGMSPAYAAVTSPVAEDCCIGPDGKSAKLATLTMDYLGGNNDCTTSSFTQSASLVTCADIGVGPLPDLAYIVASHQESIFENDGVTIKPAARIWFQGPVGEGGSFTAEAVAATETALKGETWIHIFSGGAPVEANYRQKVAFHTSCSEPLFTGDKFAGIVITSCTSEVKTNASAIGKQSGATEGEAVESDSVVEDTTTTTTTTDPESLTTPGDAGDQGSEDPAIAETTTGG